MLTAPRVAALVVAMATITSPLVASGQGAAASSADPGERLYRTYCGTCHGTSGRGDGPMASQLRTMPADLTGFAARNGGVFPGQLLRSIVDGRGIRAHGLDEMPVWGDAFSSGPDGLSQPQAQARIDAIVKYLESIQRRPA